MPTKKLNWLCRYAPSLGALEGTPQMVWGVDDYDHISQVDEGEHLVAPVVFFGLYGLPDFYKLWRHAGRKAILWAGTDIKHFLAGYWLNDQGSIRLSVAPLATWIRKNCENYVENEVEAEALRKYGIEAIVVPSFMGHADDFPVSYQPNEKVRLYTSVSGDNFEQYGWDKIPDLAKRNPDVEFHLYGRSDQSLLHPTLKVLPNVYDHGRIPKERMNEEVKGMTGALRLTEFDGFSEIIAKSLLWGQWPVSIIPYPFTKHPEQIHLLKNIESYNQRGREWLLSVVNKYPWNSRK